MLVVLAMMLNLDLQLNGIASAFWVITRVGVF